MTVDAEALGLRELAKLRDAGHDPREVIENAVLRGWQGLYAPKPDNGPPGARASPRGQPTLSERNAAAIREFMAGDSHDPFASRESTAEVIDV